MLKHHRPPCYSGAISLPHLYIRLCISLFAVSFAPVQATEFDTRLPMHQGKSTSFYVTGLIEGLGKQEFLVDTGASYMTLGQDELDTLKSKGLAHYQRDITGRMADGTRKVVPIYRIARVSLDGRCDLLDVEVAVFPKRTRKLLGLSALQKAGPFIFSMDPPEIVLSDCTGTASS